MEPSLLEEKPRQWTSEKTLVKEGSQGQNKQPFYCDLLFNYKM